MRKMDLFFPPSINVSTWGPWGKYVLQTELNKSLSAPDARVHQRNQFVWLPSSCILLWTFLDEFSKSMSSPRRSIWGSLSPAWVLNKLGNRAWLESSYREQNIPCMVTRPTLKTHLCMREKGLWPRSYRQGEGVRGRTELIVVGRVPGRLISLLSKGSSNFKRREKKKEEELVEGV